MTPNDTLARHLFRIPIERLLARASAQQALLEEVWEHHRRTSRSALQLVDDLLSVELGAPDQHEQIKKAGIEAITNGLLVARYENLRACLEVELELFEVSDPQQLMDACADHVRAHHALRGQLLTPPPTHPSPLEAEADRIVLAELTQALPQAPAVDRLDQVQAWLEDLATRFVELHAERPAAHAQISNWSVHAISEAEDVRTLEREFRLGLRELLVGDGPLDDERQEWVQALQRRADVRARVQEADAEFATLTVLAPWLARVAPLLPDPHHLHTLLTAATDLEVLWDVRQSWSTLGIHRIRSDLTALESLFPSLARRYPGVPTALFRTVREGLDDFEGSLDCDLDVADTLQDLTEAVVAEVVGRRPPRYGAEPRAGAPH